MAFAMTCVYVCLGTDTQFNNISICLYIDFPIPLFLTQGCGDDFPITEELRAKATLVQVLLKLLVSRGSLLNKYGGFFETGITTTGLCKLEKPWGVFSLVGGTEAGSEKKAAL